MRLFGFEAVKSYWGALSTYGRATQEADRAFFQTIQGNRFAKTIEVSKHSADALMSGALAIYSVWLLKEESLYNTPNFLQQLFFGTVAVGTAYRAINAASRALHYYRNGPSQQHSPLPQVNSMYTPEYLSWYLRGMFRK